jgi:hypothetical protein
MYTYIHTYTEEFDMEPPAISKTDAEYLKSSMGEVSFYNLSAAEDATERRFVRDVISTNPELGQYVGEQAAEVCIVCVMHVFLCMYVCMCMCVKTICEGLDIDELRIGTVCWGASCSGVYCVCHVCIFMYVCVCVYVC